MPTAAGGGGVRWWAPDAARLRCPAEMGGAGHLSAGRYYLMEAMALASFAARSEDNGAEPACDAAAFWPASLMM